MGEISFKYMRKFSPIYETSFKYWFEDSKEYSFAYQRYIALSDTSIFNDPVAISKVATGFYDLHDLFIDKNVHSIVLYQDDSNIHRESQKIVLMNDFINTEETNRMSIFPILYSPEKINRLKIYDNFIAYKDRYSINKNNLNNLIFAEKINRLKIYDNLLVNKVCNLNILHDIYQARKINKMKILQDNLCSKILSYTNIYDNINVEIDRNIINILPILMSNGQKIYINKYRNDLMSTDIKIANYNNDLFGKFRHKPYVNIIKTILSNRDIIITNIIEQINTQKEKFYHANIIEQINTSTYMKHGNINKILNSPFGNRITNIYNHSYPNSTLSLSMKYDMQLSYMYSISVSKKYNYDTNSFNTILINKNNIYNGFITSCYGFIKQDTPTCKFYIDTFTITQEKYVFTTIGKTIDVKNIKDAMTTYGIWTDVKYKNVFVDNKNEFVINNYKNSSINNNLLFLNKSYKETMFANNIVFYSKFNKNVFTTTGTFFYKLSKHSSLANNLSFLYKKYVHAGTQNIGSFLYKLSKPTWTIQSGIYTFRKNKHINKLPVGVYVYKVPKDMNIIKDKVFMYKIPKDISIYDKLINMFRISYNMFIIKEDIWLIKDAIDTFVENQVITHRNHYFADIYNQGHFLLKKFVSIDTGDIEPLIKNQLPLDTLNSITENFSGMIIPVSKVKHQAFIDYIDEMIYKLNKDAYISNITFSSVLPKNVYKDEFQLFCDKEPHKVFIEYKNNMITKSKIYTLMHNDIFIEKESKKIYINKILSAKKEQKKVWVQDTLEASKAYHEMTIHQDEIAKLEINEMSILKTLFVDKDSQICYYTYGTFAEKDRNDLLIHQDILATQDRKGIHLADLVPEAIKEKTSIFYDYIAFTNRIIKESKLYQQMDEISKISKELMLHPDDFGNWAWVYETPDPMDPVYGIDELLLPENDTRYEDFEDIIFNKKTLKPRRPVKIINETTFIAKYPNKHPIPEYKDIAIDYDKSAVKFEQYYGIETEIMRTVFLKYYRIWQSKIFEFGSMNMVQAVKKMLDYLYSWIMTYFNAEDVEQALRVFKLIRWYGESAIIQNSQYIISYEFDTLESKLTTGTCAIPNNLDPISNDSMIVDASLGVIKNNPIYIGPNSSAHIEFYIDNRKNTSITFSLSNTVGSVNIYINDILVDTISSSALNITYPIPYTGDINVVKIEKPIGHNLNQFFYIGNIKVPNLSFKDLSIEFDPTLKMGNKPLDEIAKKMIQYADMYDDMKEAYYRIKRNNLGIQETYKKMLEYWELHHQNKTKGKRLTIKEV